ncbi:MAG: DUF1559 domain-containing protein [Planctomycetaceae bacterium]
MGRTIFGRQRFGQRPQRGGFSLVDLAVSVAIVATLLALILPSIRVTRGSSHLLSCRNNLKNLALAMHNYAGAHQGHLPASQRFQHRDGGRFRPMQNWVVSLLPYVDRRDIADRWNFDQPFDSPANSELGSIPVRVLYCPDDTTRPSEPRQLSYVVNHGYMSVGAKDNFWDAGQINWNRNNTTNSMATPDIDAEDADAHRDTGMFWQVREPGADSAMITRSWSHGSFSLDRVYDGSSQTILLSENSHAGLANAGPKANWASPNWRRCTFVLPIAPYDQGPANYRNPFDSISKASSSIGVSSVVNGTAAGLGSENDVRFAAPNSQHPNGVNVAWVDGSVGFVSEDIAPSVYARLVSPAGSRPRSPESAIETQEDLSDQDF